jgi:hypothetical protein
MTTGASDLQPWIAAPIGVLEDEHEGNPGRLRAAFADELLVSSPGP